MERSYVYSPPAGQPAAPPPPRNVSYFCYWVSQSKEPANTQEQFQQMRNLLAFTVTWQLKFVFSVFHLKWKHIYEDIYIYIYTVYIYLYIYISTYKLSFQHRQTCLLKQQTSFTVYSLLIQEIKLPFSVSICSQQTEVWRFRFSYIYIQKTELYIYILYTYSHIHDHVHVYTVGAKSIFSRCRKVSNFNQQISGSG